MRPIKQGIVWGILCQGEVTPEQAVALAQEIGISAFDFAPEEEWGRIRDAGLELSLVIGHMSLREGMNKREHHDRIVDELSAGIEKAARWHIRNLCCFSEPRHRVH